MLRGLCLIIACMTSAQAALNGLPGMAMPESFSRIDEQPGLVRIRCRLGGVMRYFRGALIDTARSDVTGDVVLTALHGLPDDADTIARACIVIARDGSGTGIERVWRPPVRGRVSAGDWAVLLTEQRVLGPARRLSILSDRGLRELGVNGVAVRLPLLTPSAERECSLRSSAGAGSTLQPKLFAHTCVAWPGHSGSPILIEVDGRTFVLGIHLGRRRNFIEHTVIGIGRTIDTTIVAAIDAAVAAGAAADIGTGDSRGARHRRARARSGTILQRADTP